MVADTKISTASTNLFHRCVAGFSNWKFLYWMVDKDQDLDTVEKMQYLKMHVTGEAVLRHVPQANWQGPVCRH